MKIVNILRSVGAAFALVLSAQASAAPILLVNGDRVLTGVHNLDVAGTLYDVAFANGTCNALFSGCSVFALSTRDTLALGISRSIRRCLTTFRITSWDSMIKLMGVQLATIVSSTLCTVMQVNPPKTASSRFCSRTAFSARLLAPSL